MHGTPCDQLSEVLIEFPRKRDFPAVREHQEKLLAELRWFDSWAMFSMDGKWIIWGDCEFGVAICGVHNGEPLETLAASKYFSLRRSVVDPMVLANFSQGYEREYRAFMQVMKESYSLADE
jgi:hypothetical protein